MSDLKFITKGDVSPRGLPRVFFTAHPDDYKRYFKEVSEDILKHQKSAVYYLDAAEDIGDLDEYEFDLAQMQLFAVPITSKLLCEPNRAMDVDIPIAIKNHIPILPLMQEDDLVDLFNKKFGNIQFLDKNNEDNTALDFDDKLGKFLSSVLIGEELAEKIKKAFDIYVFLSYRKKDRRHANRLMKLIHKNPDYLSTAIWYDEFLIPGENFNDSIETAFNKSDIFALTVTENLLEPGNYVKEKEYKELARERMLNHSKEDKFQVVPVEMYEPEKGDKRTNIEKLKDEYPDIPNVLDEHDAERVSKTFNDAMASIGKKKSERSSEHNYFIGLAYLSGIDVEVNHSFAKKLITESADAGCIEAAYKIVSMYAKGEGVERNLKEAANRQEILSDMLEKAYYNAPSTESLTTLIDALINLGGFYSNDNVNEHKKAENALNKALGLCEIEYFDGVEEKKIDCLTTLGQIAQAQGKIETAVDLNNRALQINIDLCSKENSVTAQNSLSCCYENLGELARIVGQLEEADAYYNNSLDIREKIADETDLAQHRYSLSVSCELRGNIRFAMGDYNKAYDYYKRSLKIRERLAEENTYYSSSHRNIAVCYHKIGRVYMELGEYDSAKKFFDVDLDMTKMIDDYEGSFRSREDLAATYEMIGILYLNMKEYSFSRKYLIKSLEIRESLAEEAKTIEIRRNLTICLYRLGELEMVCGNKELSLSYFNRAVDISKELIALTPAVDVKRHLMFGYQMIANIAFNDYDIDTAEKYFLKAAEIGDVLFENTKTIEMLSDMMSVKSTLAAVAQAKGDLFTAEKYNIECAGFAEIIYLKLQTLQSAINLAKIYFQVSLIQFEIGKKTEAEQFCKKALNVSTSLKEHGMLSPDILELHAEILCNMGEITEDPSCFKESNQIWKELSQYSSRRKQSEEMAVYTEKRARECKKKNSFFGRFRNK